MSYEVIYTSFVKHSAYYAKYDTLAIKLSEHQKPFHVSNLWPKFWEAVTWKLVVQMNIAVLYIYDELLAVEFELIKPDDPKFIRRDEHFKKVLTTGAASV